MPFSPLTLFDRLVPKDSGSQRLAHDLAYGDAPRQRLDLYAPKHRSGTLPVLVFVYGGSWSDGDKSNYRFVGRAFAAKGFLTVIADYRLLPAVQYPAFIEDVAATLSWVHRGIAVFGGDPERIVVAGHSAGAYNGVMALADPVYLDPQVRRAVRGFAGLSGPYDFYPFDVDITIRTFGHLDAPLTTQPVEIVDDTMPPVWLGHGVKDTLVYLRNTVALARVLREKGVSVTETHYGNFGHPDTLLALSRPLRRRAPVLDDIAEFAHRVTDASHAAPQPVAAVSAS